MTTFSMDDSIMPTQYLGESGEEEKKYSSKEEKRTYTKNLVAFWIFGLCNNFAYVVMLSAAHDVLDEEEDEEERRTHNSSITTTLSPITTTPEHSNNTYLDCNGVSTGVILLADILPTLIVKATFPFFMQKISYKIKILLIALFGLISFVIVALAHDIWLTVLGVVSASIGAGLGEITFLSLTTFYPRNVVSMWSSGTGGAGVFGAVSYAGLTSAGLSARNTLLLMTTVPVALLLTYFLLLNKTSIEHQTFDDGTTMLLDSKKQKTAKLSFKDMVALIPSLMKYMVPLTLVYFAEYFINQGLHELLYFKDQFISKDEQYRWFQVDYQIGVFISRSSVNFFHLQKLWLMPILQFVNVAVLLLHVFYRYIPSLWIVFGIVLWEGLLGGGAYVNTFYKMSNEIAPEIKEYSISIATLGDSIGIAIAGAVAIPTHNAICDKRIKL